MCLMEVKGEHLKGGLIVEGIELRPKEYSQGLCFFVQTLLTRTVSCKTWAPNMLFS